MNIVVTKVINERSVESNEEDVELFITLHFINEMNVMSKINKLYIHSPVLFVICILISLHIFKLSIHIIICPSI